MRERGLPGPRSLTVAALSFIGVVLAILGVLPVPHTRIHYLIAGTTPTGIGLAVAIVWVERQRLRRRRPVRRVTAEGDS